jgi:hypothetical protein
MPAVQAIRLNADGVTIVTAKGEKTFLASQIPANRTIAQAEALANQWAANNIDECQVRVHIFSLSPFHATVGTWDLGIPIAPAEWWE